MKNSRRGQQEQVSKLMIFSLVVMIAGFITATPLSLILTIPAYILADKVSYETNWLYTFVIIVNKQSVKVTRKSLEETFGFQNFSHNMATI